MDIKKWSQHFDNDNYPDYSCPTCRIGVLKKINLAREVAFKQPFFQDEIEDYGYYRYGKKYIFSSILKCGNKDCQQIVSMIGEFLEDYEAFDSGQLVTRDFSSYFPKYFYPNLQIFDYPENLPEKIKEEINHSFANFFADTASSANKIRRAIELLVSELKAPKYTLTNKIDSSTGKRKKHYFKLHARITKLGKLKKRTSEMLLGLKVIGNEGSHYNENKIEHADILDAYQVLEFILQKEFADKENKILEKAKKLKNRT